MSVGVDDPRNQWATAIRTGAVLLAMGALTKVPLATPRAVAIGLALGVAAGVRDRHPSDSFEIDWRLAQVEDGMCRNRDNISRLVGLVERSVARS